MSHTLVWGKVYLGLLGELLEGARWKTVKEMSTPEPQVEACQFRRKQGWRKRCSMKQRSRAMNMPGTDCVRIRESGQLHTASSCFHTAFTRTTRTTNSAFNPYLRLPTKVAKRKAPRADTPKSFKSATSLRAPTSSTMPRSKAASCANTSLPDHFNHTESPRLPPPAPPTPHPPPPPPPPPNPHLLAQNCLPKPAV